MSKKILMLDAISRGVPLGSQYMKAFEENHTNVIYVDLNDIKKRRFYKLKRFAHKHIINRPKKHDYFRYPKIEGRYIENLIQQYQPTTLLIMGFVFSYIEHGLLQSLQKKYQFEIVLLDSDSANFTRKLPKFYQFIKRDIEQADTVITFAKRMAHYFQGLYPEKNVHFFPFGYEPIAKKTEKKEFDLFFIGFPDIRRMMHFEYLRDFDIKIYGKPWDNYMKFLSDPLKRKIITQNLWGDELYDVMHRAKIVLSVNQGSWHNLDTGINSRVFEALASQCFLIADHYQEIEELFVVGEELETFKSIEELIDKINFYLKHDEARDKIAKKGYEKIMNQFTYQQRAKELLKLLT